jgi:hypothetical protein
VPSPSDIPDPVPIPVAPPRLTAEKPTVDRQTWPFVRLPPILLQALGVASQLPVFPVRVAQRLTVGAVGIKPTQLTVLSTHRRLSILPFRNTFRHPLHQPLHL